MFGFFDSTVKKIIFSIYYQHLHRAVCVEVKNFEISIGLSLFFSLFYVNICSLINQRNKVESFGTSFIRLKRIINRLKTKNK